MNNITRKDAAKWLTNLHEDCGRYQDLWHYAEALDQIIELLSADVVPVVWCKDCEYWDKDTLRHNSNDVAEWDECECKMLARRDRWNEIDRYCCDMHFCADGERKDDETD